MYQQNTERDELRARFTKWMEVVAYITRRNYLMALNKKPQTVSLETVGENLTVSEDEKITEPVADRFLFEFEALENAFSQLPPVKKKVLIHLFVLEEQPEEIAGKLGCTVQNVYNHRSLALKQLRFALEGEGERDE